MVDTLSVRDLRRMTFHRRRRLLDLRDPEDFAAGHYPGAENYPYEDMEAWKQRLPRDAEYILLCEHGSTALRAAAELERLGYQAAAVVGGYSYLQF
ncbi:rhodanese-like domain-containing protein [Cuneatibacter sp. NSJ-177]|jgi:rhodanese-related sulfurtransferase|uniref:rhodanese-like domain-containing protein n=1 Tax=Cuneatibacter sp. NSJ-177 TaxID=2931401 RepID=UPI001FD0EC66|nr:rhodanese-like domain-containing protein [Cuneatibacter sp. NSJ-177]MCJ7837488.1 rhodanese-like domain-containing protein [Cuneatibacter sp. NSJ-177]